MQDLANIAEQPVAPGRFEARTRIMEFEAMCAAMPQVDVEITHEFADGVCARTMRLAAGTTVVGKLHKTKHLYFILNGTVLVHHEGGSRELVGPLMVVAEPGEKRVIHAITDVVWTNIHATNETDPAKIEGEVIAPDYEALGVALLGRP